MATAPHRDALSAHPPERARVHVSRHDDYGEVTRVAVERGVQYFLDQGDTRLGRAGTVLLKPTLQHGRFSEPYHRLTTHPAVVRALTEVFLDLGARVQVGSVPSAGRDHLGWLYELASTHDVELIDFQSGRFARLRGPANNDAHYLISERVLHADCVVSCANLQMHKRLSLAGGIKNMMNSVSERQQRELFAELYDSTRLSHAVADIFSLVMPTYSLLDLTSVRINQVSDEEPVFVYPACIVASTDAVAAEAAACRIVGVAPREVPTLAHAASVGLGSLRPQDFLEVGDDCALSDEEIVAPPPAKDRAHSTIGNTVTRVANGVLPKQVGVIRSRCTRCKACVETCPSDALSLDSVGVPVIDAATCTNCQLCVDACAHDALALARTILGRPLADLSPTPWASSAEKFSLQKKKDGGLGSLPSRIWARCKRGGSLRLGPVRVHVRAQKDTCKKPMISRHAPPSQHEKVMKEPETSNEPARTKLLLIVGAGKKLGRSLALRFAREGFNIALCARNIDALSPVIDDITGLGVHAFAFQADATQSSHVAGLFEQVSERLGVPDIVVYNVEAFGPGTIMDISEPSFRQSWEANCLGGFLVGQEAALRMTDRGQGTIIFTGATASTRGKAGYINLAVGKGGLRALAQCMAKELGPKGVHVAHVVLDGGMLAMNPEAVAQNYWNLYDQPNTAWTFELDLRTNVEPW